MSRRVFVVLVLAFMCRFMAVNAQGSSEIIHLPDYLPVRELITTGRVQAHVLERQLFDDRVEFEVVLSNDKGRTIGGYAPPYIQAGQDAVSLWREYIHSHLNVSATDDRISIAEERRAQDMSFAVAFVLDHSLSMTMPRAIRMQRAIQQAMSVFERDDYVSVVKFTSKVRTEVPLSNDKPTYMASFKVNGINFRDDGTAIHDAAIAGLRQIETAPASARRVLIVFTDGEDNASTATMDEVRRVAREVHATVFAVTYGVGQDEELAQLAQSTGGRIHRLHDVYDFDRVFLGIYNGLRHSYIVRVDHRSRKNENDLFTGAVEPTSTGYGSLTASEILPMINISHVRVDEQITTSEKLALGINLSYLETSDLHPSEIEKLDALATLMIQRNDLTVEILNEGSQSDATVGMRRTQAVRELLVRRGVDPRRVQGYGQGREARQNSHHSPTQSGNQTTFIFKKM